MKRILFLCTGNSCRSQMAEGWARKMHGRNFDCFSAGTRPTAVDPLAVQVMREVGVDISSHQSKHVDILRDVQFDLVVTVCDAARESCPLVPTAGHAVHVSFDDPPQLAKTAKTKEEVLQHYRRVRDEIAEFIKRLPDISSSPLIPVRLALFERYLSLWVVLCMIVGVLLGKGFPEQVSFLSNLEFGRGSQVNIPIAVLIWLMIFPMMLKVDFGSLVNVTRKPKGLVVTLFVNWLVKPFSMAALAWLFLQNLFLPLIGETAAREYTAGLIILAAAPCTAMVFVWSQLTRGDPAYTLVQVAVNDLIMLVAFAPIVMLLLGISNVVVPTNVLVISVVVFIVIPLSAGILTRRILINLKGISWLESRFIPRFQPVTIGALLLTLVLIFAFQAGNLSHNFLPVFLIAIPIIIQVYFNSSLAYLLMYLLKVPHAVASPGALIGASNFFELAVAVAITLFGPASNAALATVVGVLVEVPVMLSVCAFCNKTVDWYARRAET